MIAALIFDVDGTLAETEEAHRKAFNVTFFGAGLDWYWDRELYRELLRVTGGKERMRAYHERFRPKMALSDAVIADLHRKKTRVYNDIIAGGGVSLRPGVRELIAFAGKRRMKVAVATTTNSPNVEGLCIASWSQSAAEVFDVVAAGDEAPNKKPAPDIYNIALDRLGLAPEQCIAFEDSRNGLLSAKSAGLRVVATPSRYSASDDFTGADIVLPDLVGLEATDFWQSALAAN
jgi:HAD superfamily hydrolase (TIGR01509 family)